LEKRSTNEFPNNSNTRIIEFPQICKPFSSFLPLTPNSALNPQLPNWRLTSPGRDHKNMRRVE
jgi:hypothetical protein